MTRLIGLALLLSPLALHAADEQAQIYRSVDEQGNVIYTDTPPTEDAEPVELDPINTIPAPATDRATGTGRKQESQQEPAAPAYSGVEIAYPSADEAIRHNGGQVPFRISLRPAQATLAESHRVEIFLDGSKAGSGDSLTVTVGPVDRGPHQVSARIVDSGGNVLARSGVVNFFLLRHSVQQP